MKYLIPFAILLAIAASCVQASSFFPMGVWYEGAPGALRYNLIPQDPAAAAKMYQRDFADIAAHGVNIAVVPNTPPSHHKCLLDAAAANGIKLIIELDNGGGELGEMIRGSIPYSEENVRKTLDEELKPILNHPALFGVQLLDEPRQGTYETYASIAESLKKYAPTKLPFTCLAGVDSVGPFVKAVRPKVVAFDRYTVGVGNKVGDKNPMLLFDSAAASACNNAAKYNVPVWAVIQVHSITHIHRFPTPAEIRCMTYSALSNGCKGVFWFMYQTEYWNKEKNEFMKGLVDQNFKGDERWEEIKKLTGEISKLSPTLLNLQLVNNAKVQCNGIAHVLKDPSGKLYVFAVNTDTVLPQAITIRLNSNSCISHNPMVAKYPLQTNKTIEANLCGSDVVWSDTLAPGDGALYLLQD